jgi:hypothetical protein
VSRLVLPKAAVVVPILVLIAVIHALRLGTHLGGNWFTLYYSYFSDIVVPFGIYFLLCLNDITLRFLRSWRIKAIIVFGFASGTEVAQAFGLPVLGLTFDPLGIVMFAVGVSLAAALDRLVMAKALKFWAPKN